MDEIDALYQEVILDHYKRPRNWGAPEHCDRKADGHNPLCGDRMTVYVDLDGERIADVHVDGAGCAISVASASIMSETVKGHTVAEAQQLFDKFHAVVTGQTGADANDPALQKLAVFAGVAEYPARVKCATLAWHTVNAALSDQGDTVTTE